MSCTLLGLAFLVLPGGVVGQLVLVAGLLQRLLVQWDAVVKDDLAGGEVGESPVHSEGDVPDHAGGVVAVHVDVADAAFRLVVEPVGHLRQVHGDVQEVDLTHVCL